MTNDQPKDSFWSNTLGLVVIIGFIFIVRWCAGCGQGGPKPTADPYAEAQERVSRFDKKRASLKPLLEKAQADRNDLVAKLRAAGVNSPADLKGNFRGQQLAASLRRLIAEIDGLERQITALDTAVIEARAIVRRQEREQAGLNEDELRKMAEQLREVEERTGTPMPVMPLDVDAALERALKATPRSSPKK